MATFRDIWIDPTGVGDKEQWVAYGAATDWQAVSKPSNRPPSVPSNSSGISCSTSGEFTRLTFPPLTGLLMPGETVSWVRVWRYYDGAIPVNHEITVGLDFSQGGLGAAELAKHGAGLSGWQTSERVLPFGAANSLLAGAPLPLSDPLKTQVLLIESATQAADTKVTQELIQVRVSDMEHLVPSGRQLVGAFTGRPQSFTVAQYGSVNFDPWFVDGTEADIRFHLRSMRDRGLELVRIFVPFGQMMTSATAVNETAWQKFESFLDWAAELDVRLDVTGLVTFNGPATAEVPSWLDQSDGTPVLSETDRNLAFALWWNRCAKACSGSPAVAIYDPINEPMTQAGGSDYYYGAAPHYYGGMLCLDRGARTDLQVITDFYNQMRTEIEKWDTRRGVGLADHYPTGNSANYQNAGVGSVGLPHLYLKDDWRSSAAARVELSVYTEMNKPMMVEESGALPPTTGGVDAVQDFYYRSWLHERAGRLVGHSSNWVGAFDTGTYERTASYREWRRRVEMRRQVEAERVCSRAAMVPRIGQRYA